MYYVLNFSKKYSVTDDWFYQFWGDEMFILHNNNDVMMICFPARGDDSEEQRKRLQQSPALFRPLGNTSFSQQLPESR